MTHCLFPIAHSPLPLAPCTYRLIFSLPFTTKNRPLTARMMLRILYCRKSLTLIVVGEARVIRTGARALMNLNAISLEMRPVEQIILSASVRRFTAA